MAAKLTAKQYQHQYYTMNKSRLQRKKRARYETDAAYRRTIKISSRIAYVLKRMANVKKPIVVEIDGRQELLLLLKQVAKFIGRNYTVVYRWRVRGYLPKHLTVGNSVKKYYTYSNAQYLKEVVTRIDAGDYTKYTYDDLYKILSSVWDTKYDPNKLPPKETKSQSPPTKSSGL